MINDRLRQLFGGAIWGSYLGELGQDALFTDCMINQ